MLQQRWMAKLIGLDCEILYKKGKENQAADALSRIPESKTAASVMCILSHHGEGWLREISQSYDEDNEAQNIIQGIASNDLQFKDYVFNNGLIKKKGISFIGNKGGIRNKILWELHDSSMGAWEDIQVKMPL